MIPKVCVDLVLSGQNFVPNELTTKLSITPSESWTKGDVITRSSLVRQDCGWRVGLEKVESLHLNEQVEQLLRRVEPVIPQIAAVALELSLTVTLSCAVYCSDQTPSMHLDRRVLDMLHRLSAEVDIDVILC